MTYPKTFSQVQSDTDCISINAIKYFVFENNNYVDKVASGDFQESCHSLAATQAA